MIHPHCYVCVLNDWFVNRFCVDGMFWIHFYLYFIPSVCMYSLIVCLCVFYIQGQTASFIMEKVFIWMDSYGERRWIFDEERRKWAINPANPCTWGMFSERYRNIPHFKSMQISIENSEYCVLSHEFVCIWLAISHVFLEYYGNTINLCVFDECLYISWMFVMFIVFVFDRYLWIEIKTKGMWWNEYEHNELCSKWKENNAVNMKWMKQKVQQTNNVNKMECIFKSEPPTSSVKWE